MADKKYGAMSRSFKAFLALVVLVVAWDIFVPQFVPFRRGNNRIMAAQVDIASFNTAISMFQYDCGRCPTTEEGLAALIVRPPAIPAARWRGRYLDLERIHGDPWGRAYVYECPGLHNTNGYDVYSLGRHGKGGEEAIGNWTPVEHR